MENNSFNLDLSDFRYEKKFKINNSSLKLINNFLSENELRFIKSFSTRKINSIYFDTNELNFYNENIEGFSKRKKYRFRWYGNIIEDKNIDCNLEIKIKDGLRGIKKIFPIQSFMFNKKGNFSYEFNKSSLPKNIFNQLKILKPQLFVSYKREYYVSKISKIRLTIDKNICYQRLYSKNKIRKNIKILSNDIILELKYPYDTPPKFIKALELPFRLSKNSKYVEGLNKYIR